MTNPTSPMLEEGRGQGSVAEWPTAVDQRLRLIVDNWLHVTGWSAAAQKRRSLFGGDDELTTEAEAALVPHLARADEIRNSAWFAEMMGHLDYLQSWQEWLDQRFAEVDAAHVKAKPQKDHP